MLSFREATDRLFERIDHEQLARTIGVSVASIRQARLKPEAKAFREAPKAWEDAVLALAEEHLRKCNDLIAAIRRDKASSTA